MAKFIVCEGMDRSGKTSTMRACLATLAAEGIPAIYRKGLLSPGNTGRLSRERPCTLTFLLEQYRNDLVHIGPALKQGLTVLQDRWFYTVLAHNPPNELDDQLGAVFRSALTQPDALVYFTVQHDEWVRRLAADLQNPEHRKLYESPALLHEREARLLAACAAYNGPKYTIDTTEISIAEAGKKLHDIVMQTIT